MGGTQTIRWKEGGDSSRGWRRLQQRADAGVRRGGTGNCEVEEKSGLMGNVFGLARNDAPDFGVLKVEQRSSAC